MNARTLALFAVSFGVVAIIVGFPYFVLGPGSVFSLPQLRTPEPEAVTVIFTGDVMLDRQIRLRGLQFGYDSLLAELVPLFKSADAVLVNLEGPITSTSSVSVGTIPGSALNYSFTFATETAPFLARTGITYASLGNNHILNQGWQGLAETEEHLANAGIRYFGVPGSENRRSVLFEKDGIRIIFVNHNEFWRPNATTTLRAVAEAKRNADFVVMYAHWGNEYEKEPREDQRQLAEAAVAAGADLVIGSHPHVVQSHELFRGVPIYYSLGNFVFDQYWNKEVSCGLVLRISFQKARLLQVEEVPVSLHKKTGATTLGCDPELAPGA